MSPVIYYRTHGKKCNQLVLYNKIWFIEDLVGCFNIHPQEQVLTSIDVYLFTFSRKLYLYLIDIWPSGEYGLPKAISGCPAKFSGVSWEEGWIQQDLEDDDASHDKTNSSSSFHMDANFTNEYLRRTFCMKIGYTNLKLWPNGMT